MSNVSTEEVITCHSSTCNHFSHEGGYTVYTGQVPDEVETALIGTSVSSHGITIRTDDAEGQAQKAVADLRRNIGQDNGASRCSRAGERHYSRLGDELRQAERTLQLIRAGIDPDDARKKAQVESDTAAKEARREKRATAIKEMVDAGMTGTEALRAYGIGPWSNEVDWPAVKRAVEADRNFAHKAFSEGIAATSRCRAEAWLGQYFSGSYPRMTAWADYAIIIFFDGVRLLATGREYPVGGKGWRLIA